MSLPSLNIYHREAYPAISPELPSLNQSGKVVLITGAGSGIGFAIARAFVLAGAEKVIMLGRRPDVIRNAAAKLNAETGRSSAEGRVADAFDVDAIDALWSDLNNEGTYVDVLVLNAASFGATKPILEASQEETWQAFEANVRTPLAMAIKFAKQTTGTNKKYLVNVSTIAAYMWSTMGPERPTYGLTKNAGTLLLQQIAKDTSPDEMQVVSYHPGGIFTEASYASGFSEDGTIKWENANLPGNFAVWAASPEATFLHGRFVWANWDVEELRNGVVGKQILEDEHFLKVGIEGLTEKDGGAGFLPDGN